MQIWRMGTMWLSTEGGGLSVGVGPHGRRWRMRYIGRRRSSGSETYSTMGRGDFWRRVLPRKFVGIWVVRGAGFDVRDSSSVRKN